MGGVGWLALTIVRELFAPLSLVPLACASSLSSHTLGPDVP